MAVNGSKVTATFKNGVLIVTLPKTPAAKGTNDPREGRVAADVSPGRQ